MTFTLRSHVDDIFLEFLPVPGSKVCVVICDGVPGTQPSKKEIMLSLAKKGYSSLAPRYRGTRESKGQFLQEPPAKDLIQLFDFLHKNPLKDAWSGNEYDFSGMHWVLMGSSWGGAVILDALQFLPQGTKSILLSPVISLDEHNREGDEDDLLPLEHFMIEGMGNAYRFSHQDRLNMCEGKLFSTEKEKIKIRKSDFLVMYDPLDTKVKASRIENFCKEVGIDEIYAFPEAGHLSFGRLNQEMWELIEKFLKQ